MENINWKVPYDVDLSQVKRFIGPAENLYLIKVLDTEVYKERAMNLAWQQIFKSDPVISALNFDPVSKDSLRTWIRGNLNQHVAYGCFSQPKDYLVAVDLQHVRNNTYASPNLLEDCGEAFKRYIRYMNIIAKYIGPKSHIVDYLTTFGVFTMSSHRHDDDVDIQRGMIQFRQSVARALRIRITASAFVGSEMQTIAQEIGYKPIKELNYEEMIHLGQDPGCVEIFPIKIMGVPNKIKEEPVTRKNIKPITRKNQSAGTHKLQSKPFVKQSAADVDED